MFSKLRSLIDFINRKKIMYGLICAMMLFLPFYWLYLWLNITEAIDDFMDNTIDFMASYGYQLSCDDRSFYGYPFDIIVDCHSPKLILNESVQFSGENLKVTFDTLGLDYYLFDLEGPVLVKSNHTEYKDVEINWEKFRLRIDTTDYSISAVELKIDSVKAVQKLSDQSNVYNLDFVDFQIRDEIEEIDTLTKLTVKTGGFNHGDGSVLMKYADLDFALRVPYSELLSKIGIWNSFSTFQKNGGNLELNHFKIDSMGVTTDFEGNLFLPPNGLLSGNLNLWISGVDRLISYMNQFASEDVRKITGLIPNILQIVPKVERNGVNGIEIPVKIKNGKVQVGFFPLGSIPPLSAILNSN